MALIKTRPDVRLLLPRALVAGEVAEFIVELECPKPVAVDRVSLTLFGEIVWFTTSQYGRHRNSSRFLEHPVALLGDETELEAGTHRLRTRMQLSDELPASWTGDMLAVEYGVEIHVDIPWWPDKRAQFVVRVACADTPQPDEGPIVCVSHAGGPQAKQAYVEVALAQRSIHAGGNLDLRAALGNVEHNQYRKLQVEIVAQEAFPTGLGGHYVHEHAVARWTVGLDQHGGELQPIPFSLKLPNTLAPAFDLHGAKLTWLLQVIADVAWGVDPKLRLPLVVQPPSRQPGGEITAPLAVGSDRLRLIWAKVARQHELEFVDDHIRGNRGRVALTVLRDYEAGSPRVIALLEFPELGLGLRTRRERQGLLGSAAKLVTRDSGQGEVVQAHIGDHLCGPDHVLLDADDQRLSLAVSGAGLELDPLAAFVGHVLELARRVDELEQRLPLPTAMAEHGPAWTRAAKALGGRLRLADVCLELEREGMQLCIGCVYDDEGQLRATRLELDPKLAIPTRQHLLWTGDTAMPEHELELADLVGKPEWSELERVALHIEASRIRVLLPAPLPDPLLERDRIEALFAIGRQLRGEHGPYR